MYKETFRRWIDRIKERIDEVMAKADPAGFKNPHFDSVMALVSLSLKNCPENVTLFKKQELYDKINDIFKVVTARHESTKLEIHLLEVIEFGSRQDRELAQRYAHLEVHLTLLQVINETMLVYKQSHSLEEGEVRLTDEELN